MSNFMTQFKPIAICGPKVNVLIVGYGSIGKKKYAMYIGTGANVVSVDPKLEANATYKMTFDEFIRKHLDIFIKQHLIIIATEQSSVNEVIETHCSAHYKLFNRTDKSENSLFHDLAVAYEDMYYLAVGSGGLSPQIGPYVLNSIQMQTPIDGFHIQELITNRRK